MMLHAICEYVFSSIIADFLTLASFLYLAPCVWWSWKLKKFMDSLM